MHLRGLAWGSIAIVTALAMACGSDSDSDLGNTNTGGKDAGSGGSSTGGSGGSSTGGSSTGGSSTGGSAGSATGGSAGSATGGSAGSATGGSAGSASGGSAGTSTGGSGGTKPDGGTKTCSELASEYLTALEAAKACNPVLSVLQCTKPVGDELACPCPTFVNPANTKAAADLDALQAAWNAQNCGSNVICPAVLCPQPTNSACVAQSGSLSGKCTNLAPN